MATLALTVAGAAVVRFLPPLVVTREEADQALGIFRRVLDQLQDTLPLNP